ncbi:MAG: phage head closure protein [Clostridiales bacterium]|nr:phage head closure protein [Clostridiales bacterium]
MARAINPGKLKNRITFLSPPSGRNRFGELSDEWTPGRTEWASKEPLIGRELFAAMTAGTVVEVKFRLRYIPGVRPGMRIRHDGEEYEIISPVDVEAAHVELVCYCKAVEP